MLVEDNQGRYLLLYGDYHIKKSSRTDV